MRPEDDLADVVALMLGQMRSVPIVDDGKLVGIVTGRDFLRVVARRELTPDDVSRRREAQEKGPTRAPTASDPPTAAGEC